MPDNESKVTEETRQKENWLKEHLPYELKMMRHCLRRLTQMPQPFYLDWNAALASFAVNAGNLAAFLTNGDKGRNNFKACDFVQSFRSRKGNLDEIFRKMEPYIFHLGKSRPTDVQMDEKFGVPDAIKIAEWVEAEMEKFVSQLGELQKFWDAKGAVPPEPPLTSDGPQLFIEGTTKQAASSADPVISMQNYTGYKDPNRKD
jgi:hypothetical protein